MHQPWVKWGLFGVLVLVLGCGEAGVAPTAKVTGTVTSKGQPLAGVTVTFNPDSGRPATGTTDSSGKFTLSTFKSGDGAVPGNHKIAIVPTAASVPMPGTPEAAKAPEAAKKAFADKYMDSGKSGLTATVKTGEANDFKFDLTE